MRLAIKRLLDRLPLSRHDRILARGTVISLVLVALFQLLGFLLFTLKTRLLVPSQVGDLALATSIVVTFFFCSAGISQTALRYATFFRGQGSLEKEKNATLYLFRVTIVLLGLLLLLVNLFARPIAVSLFGNPQLIMLIRILAWGLAFQALTLFNVGLLKSKMLIQYQYLTQILQTAMIVLIALAFFRSRQLLLVLAVAYPVANLTVLIYTSIIVRREFAFLFQSSVRSEKHNEPIVRFALFNSLTALLNIFREEINIFLIAFFLSSADIALFMAAYRLGVLPTILTIASNNIIGPMVGHLYGRRDLAAIRKLHWRASSIIFALSLLIFLSFVAMARFVLGIFGDYYEQAYGPLLIVALASVISGALGMNALIITMMGRPHLNALNSLVVLGLISGLCYWLVPLYGLYGAAWAYALGYSSGGFLSLAQVLWLYRTDSRARETVEV